MAQILLVDDDPGFSRPMMQYLWAAGYGPLEAQRGHDALDLIERRRPDAIILDILLPDMDGFDLLELIVDRWPEIPVIIVTAVATSEAERLKAGRMGVADYLIKPVEGLEIVTAVRHSLSGRRLQRRRYCEFRHGICRQAFNYRGRNSCFIAYPDRPRRHEEFMEGIAQRLRVERGIFALTWKNIHKADFLFCNICDKIFETSLLVAELTTWNLNVLVELGFAFSIGRKCYILREKDGKHPVPALLQDLMRIPYYIEDDVLNDLEFDNELPEAHPYGVPRLSRQAFFDEKRPQEAGTALLLVPSNERHQRRIAPQLKRELENQRYTVSAPRIGRDITPLYDQIERSEWVIADFLPDVVSLDDKDHMANAEVAFLVGTAIGLEKKVLIFRERGTSNLHQITDLFRLTVEYDCVKDVVVHIRGTVMGVVS